MHAMPRTSDPVVPEPFRCELIPERERIRVAPAGELDLDTVPAVDEAIREVLGAGFSGLVLDLGRVTFMDSTALRLATRLEAAARADGFMLEVRPGPPAVQRLFELTGMSDRFGFRT
jgi:anti-sigma B factor antagonist